jgi:hypothetical protein
MAAMGEIYALATGAFGRINLLRLSETGECFFGSPESTRPTAVIPTIGRTTNLPSATLLGDLNPLPFSESDNIKQESPAILAIRQSVPQEGFWL